MIGGHLAALFGEKAVTPTRLDLDLGDREAVAAYLRRHDVRTVVNATGAAGKSPRELFEVNAWVARVLAEASADSGAACVYLSSSRVFDGAKGAPYRENDLPNPLDDYGLSKWLGEKFTRNALRHGRFFILRMPMVLACRENDPGRQIVTRLLARAKRGTAVKVASDVITQAVHVRDVALAVDAVLTGEYAPGAYNVTDGRAASLHAIVSRIFEKCGLQPPLEAQAVEFDKDVETSRNLALAVGQLGPCPPWEAAVDAFALEYSSYSKSREATSPGEAEKC